MTADQLSQLLDELGKRLGPSGEHVFALAVRQVYIDNILQVVLCGLGLLGLAIGTVAGARRVNKAFDEVFCKDLPWLLHVKGWQFDPFLKPKKAFTP